jgi:SAM-dependent methyltransferase
MAESAQDRQLDYYDQTAERYDDMHVQAGDEHYIALEYVLGLLDVVRAKSVLDVGCGTGRGVRFLKERRPDLRVVGLEPSDGLRAEAEALGGEYVGGGGESMPFEDDSFDVVLATGIMHHIPDPAPVLADMMRVAKSAIMLSDANRFGQGSKAMRLAKPVIHRAGLWPAFEKLRTRGKGYMESAGDGIFYSYSVYDSAPALADWATRWFVIPTAGEPRGWLGPFASSPSALLVAVREPTENWAGL